MKWSQPFMLALLSWLLMSSLAAQEPPSRSYRIGPRDEIQIRVDELPDLDSEQAVAEDGTITLPIVGQVDARGLSEDELAMRLRLRLEAEGLRKATVTVSVSAYRSRPVSILGAVSEPGNHFVPGQARLMEVLLNAGGLTASHSGEILVRRSADNGLSDQVRIDVRDLVEKGDPAVNIPIFAGDLINVPEAQAVTIHILGEVASVGSLTFRSNERVTLLTVIARAGGLSDTASKKIRIRRSRPGGERQEIVADYRDILNGDQPDVPLHDGDLIIVKESFF